MTLSPGADSLPQQIDYDDICQEPFRDLPPSAWSREFERANVLIDATVTDRCAEVLDVLGVPQGLDEEETARQAAMA